MAPSPCPKYECHHSIHPTMSRKRSLPQMNASTASTVMPSKEEDMARLQNYLDIFKDPEDVDSLQSSRVFSEEEGKREADRAIRVPPTGVKRYFGLTTTPTGANQRRIFLAVQFLVKRFHDFSVDNQAELKLMTLTRDGEMYTELSMELERVEPSLRGVTTAALYSTVGRLCSNYSSFEKLTEHPAFTTRLLELCRPLRDFDRIILRIKQETSALTVNEKARLMVTAPITRQDSIHGVRKKRRINDAVLGRSDDGEDGEGEDSENYDDDDDGEDEEDDAEDGRECNRNAEMDQYSRGKTTDTIPVKDVSGDVLNGQQRTKSSAGRNQQKQQQLSPSTRSAIPPAPKQHLVLSQSVTTKTTRMPRGYAKEQRRLADEMQSIRHLIMAQKAQAEENRRLIALTEEFSKQSAVLLAECKKLRDGFREHISFMSSEQASMSASLYTLKYELRDFQETVLRVIKSLGVSQPRPPHIPTQRPTMPTHHQPQTPFRPNVPWPQG